MVFGAALTGNRISPLKMAAAAPAGCRKAVRSVGQADALQAARRWACARAQAVGPSVALGSGRSVPSHESTTETCIGDAQVSWIRTPPLLRIAALAGGDWPERACNAALVLSGSGEDQSARVTPTTL